METKKTTNKAVVTKATKTTKSTKSQEEKTMKTTAVANKAQETKAVEKKAPEKNEEKKDTFVSIEEVTKIYGELGIRCKNPNAKGSYRIMGGGSSLNVKPKKGYYIYSNNDDLALIQASGLKNEDLVVEKGTNAQDKQRPNTIICTALETLRAVLAVYATNPNNMVVAQKKEEETAVAKA